VVLQIELHPAVSVYVYSSLAWLRQCHDV